MLNRLISYWVYGGFLAGLLLLALAPLFVRGWPPVLAATFFCLPAYMLHQYEEHDHDRFRSFVNRMVGGGHEVLTPLAVFIVNVPGVWGVIALSLWLAARVAPGLALIAVYLVLVNAAVHIAQAVAMRDYNPGLISAIVLFLPLGIWCLRVVQQTGAGSGAMHIVGLACATAIHAAIMISIFRKRRGYLQALPAVSLRRQ